MKKKKVLVIILTTLIVISAAILGVANAYRINAVCLQTSTVSNQAKSEVEELQTRLEEVYQGKNALFATSVFAEEIISDFPYFRITAFEKAYPNRIVVSITEDAEFFAVPTNLEDNSYYILNADGTVLDIRRDYKNRVDGFENLLITGLSVSGEKGAVLSGDELFESMIALCQKFSELFQGIRRNIVKIEVVKPTASLTETAFLVYMREGVKMYIENPTQGVEEKAQKAFDKYMGISFEQKLLGTILVADGENGILAEYFENFR